MALIEEQNKKLKSELVEAHQKIGRLVSINEMLRLQLNDLLTNLNFFQNHLNSFAHNASKLKSKLPDLSMYTKTPHQPVKVDTSDTTNGIDLNLTDPDAEE